MVKSCCFEEVYCTKAMVYLWNCLRQEGQAGRMATGQAVIYTGMMTFEASWALVMHLAFFHAYYANLLSQQTPCISSVKVAFDEERGW